jgi:oligoribonuclease NrnB/cAMP/cGMP phosphodiesterase (DHH superfamily)
MDRSGAGLTWDLLHRTARPWLIDFVEDRDLWRWKFDKSKEANAWISACKRDSFSEWSALNDLSLAAVIDKGEAVLAFVDRYVSEMVEQARTVDFEGYRIPIVNAPYINISELVGKLAESAPFALGWFQRADGIYAYSLRSRGPEGVDVSEIAKKYGGGGHRNSAGFGLAERLPL